jgi:putative nucleotidyltransferase with HDIG domain
VASLSAHLTERLTRKLLPLSVLLRMTMAFPDEAPSRFKIALKSGNVSTLKRQIHEAINGGKTGLAEASELVLSLSTALSAHDRKTRGHSERTRAYTDLLAEHMRLSEADRDRLRWAALLHDVGKLEVPIEILNKDGPLTNEERDIVRQHPIHGMRLVAPIVEWLGPWAKTIEHHHEQYDGTGYPHGLKGTEICLGARIVSVADAYDVMTTGRSYQARKSHGAARREIQILAGRQFDPVVVRALMNIALGRLRWATGPLAGLADLPLLRPLEALGRDFVTLATASTVTAAAAVSGILPVPLAADFDPDRAARVVVASLGLTPDDIVSEPADPGSGPGTETTTPGSEGPSATSSPETAPTTVPGGNTDSQTASSTTTIPTTTATGGPPDARPDVATTFEESSIAIPVLANDSGSGLVISSVSNPNRGSASIVGTQVRYQPNPNFSGTDAFTYQICNTGGECDSATVTVTVGNVNDPPTASALSISTPENQTGSWAPVVADTDGPGLTCSVVVAPSNGVATVNSDCSGGAYRPNAGYSGPDGFIYQVTDGSASATAAVGVTVVAVNAAPIVNPDSALANGGATVTIPVLSNDTDPDGDPLVVTGVGTPSAGSATTNGTSISFTAPSGLSGVVTFGYTACDPGGLCASTTVTVQVTSNGSGPVAVDDTADTHPNEKINIGVLSNDSDPDGDLDPSSLTLVSSPSQGTATVINGRVRYSAPKGFIGVVTFTYQISDLAGNFDLATVTVTIS